MERSMRRVILALAMITLLVLLPAKAAVAEECFMGANITVILGLSISAPLPTTQPIGDDAQARSVQGQTIPIGGSSFSIQVADGRASLTLPLALAEGQTFASFTDPSSGVVLSGDELALSLKGQDGSTVMCVRGKIEEIRPEGDRTTVVVSNVMLRTEEFSLDLTSADTRLGEVAASFEVSLKNLSQDVLVKTSLGKEPDEGCLQAFELVAHDSDAVIADVACTLSVEKTNLENGTDLGSATIIMKVGREWADRYGVGNVKIMRHTEAGECQMLATIFNGYEGDQAVFEATSPDGLSVFVLSALVPLSSAPGVWVPILAGTAGFACLVGLLIYGSLRRKRAREAVVMVRWPTGLSADDWKLR
jgi:hypothetical protein